MRLLFLFVFSAGAPFSAAFAADDPLTLERALELAGQYSPQLRFATAVSEGAEAAIATARAYPNPEFTTLAGPQYRRLPSAEPGLLQHYSVSQPLELPSLRKSRISAAEQGRTSSEYGQLEARLGVRTAVRQAFYLVLRRRSEIELARENLRLVEDLRRRIQVQVNVGEAARLELTRADAEVATAQTFVNSAQLRFLNAVASLRTAVSAPLPPNVDPRGALQISVHLPPLDVLQKEMMARHPGLSLARSEIERAQRRLNTEFALRKPQPSLYAEWERQPDLGFYRFGVSLPIPVWNKREGPISEAVAALNQARAYAELRRIELTAALERAYGLYEVASQQVASYEKGVLKEAEAALQAAEAAFKFGERGIIEVLDAQRVLRTVRSDFVTAQYDLQAALIDVEGLRAADLGKQP
ncbi:MAG: TolC family protein [Bryobacterales bacterium]|nr:TolC family protein [Bryobacterales bacterium]